MYHVLCHFNLFITFRLLYFLLLFFCHLKALKCQRIITLNKKAMAKTFLIFSGYWFTNWIRVSLWQNSNEVKNQSMIHSWLYLVPGTMSEAHSFNKHWLRVYGGPGSGHCWPCPYAAFLMSVMGRVGRKGSTNFGVSSNLFSCLSRRGRASGNNWGEGKWQVTREALPRLFSPCTWKPRWLLGDNLDFIGCYWTRLKTLWLPQEPRAWRQN